MVWFESPWKPDDRIHIQQRVKTTEWWWITVVDSVRWIVEVDIGLVRLTQSTFRDS